MKPWSAALAAGAILSFWQADTRADLRAEFQKEYAAASADAVALDETWHRLLPRLVRGGGSETLLLKCSMPGAVLGAAVSVRVYRVNGEWMPGQAWLPSLGAVAQSVEVSGLSMGEADFECRLVVRMAADRILTDNRPMEIVLQLKGPRKGTALSGSYATVPPADPSGKPGKTLRGPFTGEVTGVTGSPTRAEGLPVLNQANWTVYDFYRASVEAERAAAQTYCGIRAIEMARRHSLDYREVRPHVVLMPPVRPAFDSPSDAKRKKEDQLPDLEMDAAPSVPAATTGVGTDADPKTRTALAAVKEMRAWVGRLRAAVEGVEKGPAAPEPRVGGMPVEDPEFGPWFGERCLESTPEKPNVVPGEEAGRGPQEWASVGTWQVLGPLPYCRPDLVTPGLPEVFVDPGLAYRIDVDRLDLRYDGSGRPAKFKYSGPETLRWTPMRPADSDGTVIPPNWASRSPTGTRWGLWSARLYAFADLYSESERDAWVAFRVNRFGALWMNDELLWVSTLRPQALKEDGVREKEKDETLLGDQYAIDPILLKLRFRKGANRLLLRCDVGESNPSWRAGVCVRGRPRDAGEMRAAPPVETAGMIGASGWLGNGNGVYKGCRPPIAWDYKKKMNVLWSTPLPYWGNATPAIAGDRLFVSMEPHTLICLNRADGRILWQRHCSIIDLFADPKDKEEGWRLYDAWWKAREERDTIPGSLLRVPGWMSYSWYWAEGKGVFAAGERDERKGASAELLALLSRRAELEKSEDPQAVQEELSKVSKKIEELQEQQKDPEVERATAVSRAAGGAWDQFIRFVGKRSFVCGQEGYWQDYDGYAFASPVTDGKHVWWKNGMQAVACYDMEGNLKWIVDTQGGGSGAPTIPSTLLVDGKVLVYVPNQSKEQRRGGGMKLMALHPETGTLLWEANGLPYSGWNAGSPAVVRLANGAEKVTLIVTSGGSVVRVDDGKVLIRQCGGSSVDASPVAEGPFVMFPRGSPTLGERVVRLMMQTRDSVGCKPQFARRGLAFYGGAVMFGGLVYSVGGYTPPDVGACERWAGVTVSDALDGSVARKVPCLRKGGSAYAASVVTDQFAYMVAGDEKFVGGGPKPPSVIAVMTLGRDPTVLAHNGVDRMYNSPVIEGDRIYFRGYMGVTCVGYTGDEGRAYEARMVAQSILDAMESVKPAANVPVLKPEAVQKAAWNSGVPCSPFSHGSTPPNWWFLGPFEPGETEAVMAALGGAKPNRVEKADVPYKSGVKWCMLSTGAMHRKGFRQWNLNYHGFTDIHRFRRATDMNVVLDGKAPSVCYFYTELRSDTNRVVRFDDSTPGIRAWIGGMPMKSGDRFEMGPGEYPVLIEFRAESIPEHGLWFSPRFWSSDDVGAETRRWMEFGGRNREHLEQAVKRVPDTPEGVGAKTVLDALK